MEAAEELVDCEFIGVVLWSGRVTLLEQDGLRGEPCLEGMVKPVLEMGWEDGD